VDNLLFMLSDKKVVLPEGCWLVGLFVCLFFCLFAFIVKTSPSKCRRWREELMFAREAQASCECHPRMSWYVRVYLLSEPL